MKNQIIYQMVPDIILLNKMVVDVIGIKTSIGSKMY